MQIREANFLKSSMNIGQCPETQLPEFAFIGRSNVGKSSLINMLTNRKSLAKVSNTPGKTQAINHFTIDDSWYLVDLPGYGFAKVSKVQRHEFGELIEEYLVQRTTLVVVFVLIDLRLPPQAIDMSFISWLGEKSIPFVLVFTKADKLKPQEIKKNYNRFVEVLSISWETLPQGFITSSKINKGKDEILGFIEEHLPTR